MTPQEFRNAPALDPGWSDALAALWLDANASWEASHDRLQNDPTSEGAWVHAYLHRKEGDLGNAGYWYRRAGRPTASGSLESEWDAIAQALLEK
jgi:hypothetical protein